MLLLIDNYDSFSYNLAQMLGVLVDELRVIRNDELTVAEIAALNPQQIIISPGPGYPAAAGVCEDVIRELGGKIPIMGVCLGHQAICEALGGKIVHAKELMHGKSSMLKIDVDCPIFAGLPETIQAARYHSLAAEGSTLPEELRVVATADDGEIMAVAHREYPLYGLQFHPESIMTPQGNVILQNFVRLTEKD
jgi:anthranilate synthase component 2